MNEINLTLGIGLFLFSIFYLIYSINRLKKIKKSEYIRTSFYVKIFGGTIILLLISIIAIYKELSEYL